MAPTSCAARYSLNFETTPMPIGIMAAMQEEIDTLLKELSAGSEVVNEGRRTYHSGHLWGAPVVIVFSRWGKVAAATTATDLISDFGVSEILFTGRGSGSARAQSRRHRSWSSALAARHGCPPTLSAVRDSPARP